MSNSFKKKYSAIVLKRIVTCTVELWLLEMKSPAMVSWSKDFLLTFLELKNDPSKCDGSKSVIT